MPRTEAWRRQVASFKVDFVRSRDEMLHSLKLLGAREIIASSNVPLRRDGLPLARMAEPNDPGVAVYFERRVEVPAPVSLEWRPFVIACDTYAKVRWNLRAIGATVEALRSIQRHGASSMLEQAFTGFAALPPARSEPAPWWEVLGVSKTASAEEIRDAHRRLALEHHPDRGGDAARMAAINQARDAALSNEGRSVS